MARKLSIFYLTTSASNRENTRHMHRTHISWRFERVRISCSKYDTRHSDIVLNTREHILLRNCM